MVGYIFRFLRNRRSLGDVESVAHAVICNLVKECEMKITKQVTWCAYLDITWTVQWCMAGSREAKALSSCPEYIVGCYSKRGDKQAQEDAAITRNELRQLRNAA